MNSNQFRRWLSKQGCTFLPARGGHMHVFRGDKRSIIPQHGGKKQLTTGLMRSIIKDLEIEE
jgi:mRNA interferase HicA